MLSGDFIKVIPEEGADITYVIFSSLDIPPKEFMFWRVMGLLKGNKIFLNDEKNGWFSHGIPGVGRDVIESADNLISIINAYKVGKIVFIGPSMGGYAAKLYGALIKPKLNCKNVSCLSFGGEVCLDLRETWSLKFRGKPSNPKYDNLIPLLKSSKLNVTLVIGENDISDMYQAYLASSIENVKIYSIKNADHPTARWIGQRYDLAEFIRRFSEDDELISYPDEGDFLQKGNAAHNLYFGHLALVDGKSEEALSYLTKAADSAPSHKLTQHKLGIALLEAGKYEEAIAAQKKSIEQGYLSNAYFHLGHACNILGRTEEAINALATCLQNDATHLKARIKIAEIYFANKDYGLAELHLDKIIRSGRNDANLHRMLKKSLLFGIDIRLKRLDEIINFD